MWASGEGVTFGEVLGPRDEYNWVVSWVTSLLEARSGQAGDFGTAKLLSMSAGRYDLRVLIESRGGVHSCDHHLLC